MGVFENCVVNKNSPILIDKKDYQKAYQQIPDNEERNVLYVTGASGSGKSFYSAEYINQYI
jgi:DNA replication protein DnaC